MKIEFWVVGKTSYSYIEEGIEIYAKRLKHYNPFEMVVLPSPKSQDAEVLKNKEGEQILKKIEKDDFLVLLDERGKKMNSPQFADWVQNQMNQSRKRLIFLIGGAYGFTPEVYARANYQFSLSDMTFSHQIVRVLFLEQLYRAFTILNNEPYHHS